MCVAPAALAPSVEVFDLVRAFGRSMSGLLAAGATAPNEPDGLGTAAGIARVRVDAFTFGIGGCKSSISWGFTVIDLDRGKFTIAGPGNLI